MYTDTEGIILKQIKTVNGRRMVLLFSKKYGKISAGTSLSEKGKSKTALAMRPFTYGRYELYKNKDSYNINGADVIKSYYKIGEDVEKYLSASFVLEFTDRLTAEGQPIPALFNLLTDFLMLLEGRSQKYETPVAAYQVKAVSIIGSMPELKQCVLCGTRENISAFSIKDGGVICESCRKNISLNPKETLIYDTDFGIVNILRYFLENPLKNLEKIALQDDSLRLLREILREYSEYHFDIGKLKSESFLI